MEMKRRKLIEKEKRGEKKRNNGEEKGTKDGRWWEGKRKDVIKWREQMEWTEERNKEGGKRKTNGRNFPGYFNSRNPFPAFLSRKCSVWIIGVGEGGGELFRGRTPKLSMSRIIGNNEIT